METKQTFWLARDKSGFLYLYPERPERGEYSWFVEGHVNYLDVSWIIGDDIKWSDNPKPVNVTFEW